MHGNDWCRGGVISKRTMLNGQWIGPYTGTNTGMLVIELDERESHYEGRASTYDDDRSLTALVASIRTIDKSDAQHLVNVPLQVLGTSGQPMTADAARVAYPNVVLPETATATLNLSGDTLSVSAVTNIGTSITSTLGRSQAALDSAYASEPAVQTWEQFKTFVAALDYHRFIFRGQSTQRRLRTRYHRSGRADIALYLQNDIPTLHRRLSARTRHLFDLTKPDELGAFMSLAQHHGYPTPLLDWTYSPFIAAFFAYRLTDSAKAAFAAPDVRVRIFVFDQLTWKNTLPPLLNLTPHGLNLSILEVLPIDNERMIPQQSVTTVTNVDDVESYVRFYEERHHKQYLRVIDLPLAERALVMRELSVMGITAGSMFPSLDGVCEELREQLFP